MVFSSVVQICEPGVSPSTWKAAGGSSRPGDLLGVGSAICIEQTHFIGVFIISSCYWIPLIMNLDHRSCLSKYPQEQLGTDLNGLSNLGNLARVVIFSIIPF